MRLAISTGDPAGVGPSVSVSAALDAARRGVECVLFGHREQLLDHLQRHATHEGQSAAARIEIADVGRLDDDAIGRHVPDARCGALALSALDRAIDAVRQGTCAALVTAPMSKEAVVLSGAPFQGHTEHLARSSGLPDDAVTMLFLGPRLRVALATTHLAIRDVPSAITRERVVRSATHLGQALVRLGARKDATLAIASLNPHAGEHGLFGDEEARVLAPACDEIRSCSPFAESSIRFAGIVPAETALRRAADGALAGVVCMFHDQATIASKLLDWGEAVNVTWGLPFVRTSVDHGVAYDAAAKGQADARGMVAALRMAERLVAPGG